tara:strand:- start:6443 stop:7306 length:864 start_codon:yes stop_codon:yes gene_type:complete
MLNSSNVNRKKCFINDCGITGHIGSRLVSKYLLKKYSINRKHVITLTASDREFESSLKILRADGINECIFNGEGCLALSSGDRKRILARINRCLETFEYVALVNVTLEDSPLDWGLSRSLDRIEVRDRESLSHAQGCNSSFIPDGCYLYVMENKSLSRKTFGYTALTPSMDSTVSDSIVSKYGEDRAILFDMETYLLKGIRSNEAVFLFIFLFLKNTIKVCTGRYGNGILYEFRSLFCITLLKYSSQVVTGRYHAALVAIALGKNVEVIGYGASKFDRIKTNYGVVS